MHDGTCISPSFSYGTSCGTVYNSSILCCVLESMHLALNSIFVAIVQITTENLSMNSETEKINSVKRFSLLEGVSFVDQTPIF